MDAVLVLVALLHLHHCVSPPRTHARTHVTACTVTHADQKPAESIGQILDLKHACMSLRAGQGNEGRSNTHKHLCTRTGTRKRMHIFMSSRTQQTSERECEADL